MNVLEDYLDAFQGAIIAVSHDRYFLDRITTHLFAVESETMVPYIGGFQSYLDAQNVSEKNKPLPEQTDKKPTVGRNKLSSSLKFTFKEQRDFDTIDATIAALEDKLTALAHELEKCSSDYTRVTTIMQEQEETQTQLDEAMERWIFLQDKFEQIQAAKEGKS